MILQIQQIIKYKFVETLTIRFQYSVHASEMYMYKTVNAIVAFELI